MGNGWGAGRRVGEVMGKGGGVRERVLKLKGVGEAMGKGKGVWEWLRL